jgi:hypothetical protein
MRFDDIFDVLGFIVVVALATTIVSRRTTAQVVTAFGRAFSGAINSALGRG